ncbi:5-oxoprolinase subunit PxpA [Inhella inkyongensis]|nr:5-oxoprolinase subunit PxpA [Inhella inkyongensis]
MQIELNADVGEGGAADAELLALVHRANIACGWHAGDGATQRAALAACRTYGVRAGAHPSFPDRAGFGRREMARAPADVEADLIVQIAGLQALAAQMGLRIEHVKPHGALYNQAAREPELADAVARAVRHCGADLLLVGLAGSELLRAAQRHGLRSQAEAFADRAYLPHGSLAPRTRPGALLHGPQAVAQGLALARGEPIATLDGSLLTVQAQTLCVHGDDAGALDLARALKAAL